MNRCPTSFCKIATCSDDCTVCPSYPHSISLMLKSINAASESCHVGSDRYEFGLWKRCNLYTNRNPQLYVIAIEYLHTQSPWISQPRSEFILKTSRAQKIWKLLRKSGINLFWQWGKSQLDWRVFKEAHLRKGRWIRYALYTKVTAPRPWPQLMKDQASLVRGYELSETTFPSTSCLAYASNPLGLCLWRWNHSGPCGVSDESDNSRSMSCLYYIVLCNGK